MMGSIQEIIDWFSSHPALTGVILVSSLALAAAYAVLIFFAIGRMSPDYFVRRDAAPDGWRARHPVLRLLGHIVKNVLGAVLVLMGIAMLILPGQGILTLLIGISLMDFPGKRTLEVKIVRAPAVHRAIDKIRARAGQPPLVLPAE
jgi:hypothetical protein